MKRIKAFLTILLIPILAATTALTTSCSTAPQPPDVDGSKRIPINQAPPTPNQSTR